MPRIVDDRTFSSDPDLRDWRILHAGPTACFRTASLSASAALVQAVATRLEAEDPSLAELLDVDMRTEAVTARLPIRRDAPMTEDHLRVARTVSAVARDLAATADPTSVQTVQVALDAVDVSAVTAFWAAALDAEPHGHHLYDPRRIAPTLFVQDKAWTTPRNRFHLDVSVPHDRAEARVRAILAAGGRLLGDRYAPSWWSLIDPEGNVVDVATWQDRDED